MFSNSVANVAGSTRNDRESRVHDAVRLRHEEMQEARRDIIAEHKRFCNKKEGEAFGGVARTLDRLGCLLVARSKSSELRMR